MISNLILLRIMIPKASLTIDLIEHRWVALEANLNLTPATIGGGTWQHFLKLFSSWYPLWSFILVFIFFRLFIEGSGKTWKQDQRIRLQHVDTGVYLHSHDKKYTRIAGGQQEVRKWLEIRLIKFWSNYKWIKFYPMEIFWCFQV